MLYFAPLSAVAAAAAVASCAWITMLLFMNRSAAKAAGIPFFYFPFADSKLWYMMIGTPPLAWLIERLPRSLADYFNFSSYQRRWHAKYAIHAKHGNTIFMVSPGGVSLYIADAAVAEEVFGNRTGFVKPTWEFEHLRLFGNNIVACDESEWRQHRRLVGPPFNQRSNSLVWKETISLATEMLEQWKEQTSRQHTILHTGEDFRQLALHVISSAGFGVFLPFAGAANKLNKADTVFGDGEVPRGYSMTFRQALTYVSTNLVMVLAVLQAVPQFLLDHGPSALRRPIDAIDDVNRYMKALIDRARDDQLEDKGRQGNLLYNIVHQGTDETDNRKTLTDREIVGNLFIISVAGHETTATTLNYAFIMLALHPKAQEWVLAKLDSELGNLPKDASEWTYEVYDQLCSLKCLMFETLRLFPPISGITKWTNTPQSLTVHGRVCRIPGNTSITINGTGLHYNPEYWGPSASDFDPARWDITNENSSMRLCQPDRALQQGSDPGVYRPLPGSWVPFSAGTRSCLGRQFAQAEFVACVAVLLRSHRLDLSSGKAGSYQQARTSAFRAVARSSAFSSLTMTEEIPLALLPR